MPATYQRSASEDTTQAPPTDAEERRRCCLATLSKAFREKADRLSIGVEQEFFLYGGETVAGHDDSQRFLKALAENGGAETFADDSGIGPHIAEVALNTVFSPLAVKYDHHPHLMEAALPPVSSLHDLHRVCEFAYRAVGAACRATGLTAAFEPFLASSVPDAAVCSGHSLVRALREYRREHWTRAGRGVPPAPLLNFSAYISATQMHVGGLGWDEVPRLLHAAYGQEAKAAPFAWSLLRHEDRTPRRRYRTYLDCLGDLPLVCFPDLAFWTFEDWFDLLLRMPAADTVDNRAGGGSAADDQMTWLMSVRDLSLTKVRFGGTIEFRADPCVPTAEAVTRLAAFRVGLAEHLRHAPPPPTSLVRPRADWFAFAGADQAPAPDAALLDAAIDGLRRRGLDEEVWLTASAAGGADGTAPTPQGEAW